MCLVRSDFDGIWKELTSGSLADSIETVWNIGGSEIYRLALEKNLVDVVHVTKIASRYVELIVYVITFNSHEL